MTEIRDHQTCFGFSAVLVPVDLTPASDRILARVARLPLSRKARLTLLHVVPSTFPLGAQRRAVRDAKRVLAAEALNLSSSVTRDIKIVPVVSVGSTASEIAAHSAETSAEMIIMGRGGGRALRDTFLGSTAERVIRRTHRPVLVVRLPARARYRRPALALDLDKAAAATIAQLLKVIPAPRPHINVIHAYDPPYHGLIYPSLSDDDAEEYRDHYRRESGRKISKLMASALSHAKVQYEETPTWTTHVQHGSPRSVIAKAIKKADTDLLLLGTRGYSKVAYVFLGSVAGDVLREASCDVLVVPPGPSK